MTRIDDDLVEQQYSALGDVSNDKTYFTALANRLKASVAVHNNVFPDAGAIVFNSSEARFTYHVIAIGPSHFDWIFVDRL